MNDGIITQLLSEMLHEQLCCIGRITASHLLPDDAVWEIAKGFYLIYLRARRRAEAAKEASGRVHGSNHSGPHPGIMHILDKLDRERDEAVEE